MSAPDAKERSRAFSKEVSLSTNALSVRLALTHVIYRNLSIKLLLSSRTFHEFKWNHRVYCLRASVWRRRLYVHGNRGGSRANLLSVLL